MRYLLLLTILFFFLTFGCKISTVKRVENDNPVWIKMMDEPGVEMAKAREAFDQYWINHEHFRGDRSKQFEQWYSINSKRLDQFGKVITPAQVNSEFQKLRTKSATVQQGEWFNYGPVNVGPRSGYKRDGGRVKDLDFHPTDPNTFYVSTFKGGLFKTMDYGTSWTPLTDQLTEEVYVCEVKKDDPNTIFIGTDLGVLKSTDGGDSWNNTSVTSETNALLILPNNSNIILAGSRDGIRRSTDSGNTWMLVQNVSDVTMFKSHPTNPAILYTTTNGTPGEFYRSADSGATWQKNTTFGQGCYMGVAVTPAQPNYVYVINLRDHLGEDSFEGFYLSEDAGLTFTKQSGQTPCISGYNADGSISRGQPNYNLFVCADPVNASIVYGGGVKTWKSTDKGKTWTYFHDNVTTENSELHLDNLNWNFSPHDNRIFAVNDGGVYYLNEQNKFQMITDGLPIAEIYECSQSQTAKTNVAGGTMHCGVKLNYNGVWYTPWGGDEATCIIDPTDEKYIYHLKYEKISRSSDGGFTFPNIYPANTEKGNYTGTGTLHKGNPNTLFIGCFEVHRTNNARANTVSWDVLTSFGGSTRIQKIEQSNANHDILYVARSSQFYRSDNCNASSPEFINITSSLPTSGSVNDIETHPTNQNIVYILLGSNIYRSDNKGQSWTNITSNLPSVALLEMTIDKNTNEGIYVGTDIGVFYKDATMNYWIDFSKNLPAKRVSGMDIYYGQERDKSFLTISTDGRGFWRSTLYGVSLQAPVPGFSADKIEVVKGGTVKFTGADAQLASYEWNFEGATPSKSIDINPIVAYNTPGKYAVLLKITNSAGSVTKTVSDFITVKDPLTLGTLQLYYKFDGNLLDNSNYLRNGIATGTETYEQGVNTNDKSYSFNATNAVVVTGYKGIEGVNPRTVMAWVKTTANAKVFITWGTTSSGKKVTLKTETTGELRLEVAGGWVHGQTKITDGNWHHVAFTFADDGTANVDDVKLYVDGVLQTTTSGAIALNTVLDKDVMIGNDVFNNYLTGSIDELRIYSEVLNQSQINELKDLVTSSVEQDRSDESIQIYTGQNEIRINNREFYKGKVYIYDLLGRLLKTRNIDIGINRIEMSQNIYIVRCEVNRNNYSAKVAVF